MMLVVTLCISQMWEGKYEEFGNRRPVKLPASALPWQRRETIEEPRDISFF